MANLSSLKRRIKAANNVSKTTRAMQMIATSKLKRAQDAALKGRPYVEKLTQISQNLTRTIDKENIHPYMRTSNNINSPAGGKTLLVVISPDKGLCGGLITNLTRELLHFNPDDKNNVYLTIGKKIEGATSSLQKPILASFKFGTTLPAFDIVFPILTIIDDHFLNQKVGSVKILSTDFVNVFSQRPNIKNVLPIEFPKPASPQGGEKEISSFTLFEPSASELLPNILKHYLEMTIYQNLLESFASEQAARMVAMQNATDNAMEIVDELQLLYNKGRQEKITNEILDIGGASYTQYE